MLRRPPTSITLTPEDIASYEDRRLAQLRALQQDALQQAALQDASLQSQPQTSSRNSFSNSQGPYLAQNRNPHTPGHGGDGARDPNDELKPWPGSLRGGGRGGRGQGSRGRERRERERRQSREERERERDREAEVGREREERIMGR